MLIEAQTTLEENKRQWAAKHQLEVFWKWLPVLALLALVPCYWITFHVKGMGVNHDDGVYIVTAKSLAEGHGYKIASHPGDIVQTKYPILFPILLSLIWRADPNFPSNLPYLKALPLCTTIGWLLLSYALIRRYGHVPRSAALWALFFTAATPWTLYLSTTVMSESLFAFFLTASTFLILRGIETGSKRWLYASAAAFLAGGAFYTRSAGLAAMVAGALALVLARWWKEALLFALICSLFVGTWTKWQKQAVPVETGPEAYYTAQNYQDSSLLASRLPSAEKATILVLNAAYLLLYPYQFLPLPIPFHVHYGLLLAIGAVFWLLVLRSVSRTPRLKPLHVLIGIYLGMTMLWIWHPSRIVVPILPMLLLCAYKGLPWRVPPVITAAAAITPFIFAVGFARDAAAHNVSCLSRLPIDWHYTSAVQHWVKDKAAPGSVVLANYDPMLFLYSGHKAIRPVLVDSTGLFYGQPRPLELKEREFELVMDKYNARYLVETGHDITADPDFYRILRHLKGEGRIRLRAAFAPHYRIYDILPRPTPASAPLNELP